MNRIINRPDVHNNRQYRIRLKEAVCFCSWCDFGRGDNQTGHLARWGKKVAKKHEYATGKRRNDKKFREFSYSRGYRLCGYYDAHYDPNAERKEKRYKKMETTKGDALELLDLYIRYLQKHKGKIADEMSRGLNQRPEKMASVLVGSGAWGQMRGDDQLTWGLQIRIVRDKPYRIYIEE